MSRPDIVDKSKASSHPLRPGRFYTARVKKVHTDGKISVFVQELGLNIGPVTPIGLTDVNTYSVDDYVKCTFSDEFFNELIIFGNVVKKENIFALKSELDTLSSTVTTISSGLFVVEQTNLATKDIVQYDGTKWVNANPSTVVASTTQSFRSITTASDTPTSSDLGKFVTVDTTSGAVSITINNSLDLPVGGRIDFAWIGEASSVTFINTATVNATPGLKLRARYSAASLVCTASDTYLLVGDLSA